MDRLALMRTFEEIAERHSLTAAARRLGTSLPTVVRRLSELERQLGATLFQRTTRRVEITEDGQAFLRVCRRVRAEIEGFESERGRNDGVASGVVTVSAPFLLGEMHVAPAVTRVLARNSALAIRLILQDRVVDLMEEHVDVAVRVGHVKGASLIARKVGEVRHVVCCAPSFLERWKAPKRPADLAALPCLRVDGNNFAGPWPFRERDKSRSVAVSGPLTTNIGRPAIRACLAGLAVGRFLSYQIREEVARGDLVPLLEAYAPEALDVSLVTSGAAPVPRRVTAVIDELRSSLRRELAE